jgi:hypothetical protein
MGIVQDILCLHEASTKNEDDDQPWYKEDSKTCTEPRVIHGKKYACQPK